MIQYSLTDWQLRSTQRSKIWRWHGGFTRQKSRWGMPAWRSACRRRSVRQPCGQGGRRTRSAAGAGCTRAGPIRAMRRRRGRQRLRRLLALLGVGGWLPLRCGAVDCVCVCVISADPSEQEESDASVAFVLLLVWSGVVARGFPKPSMCTFARTWNTNIAPSLSGEARWVRRVCAGVALVALI